jgi:hypothetical protein
MVALPQQDFPELRRRAFRFLIALEHWDYKMPTSTRGFFCQRLPYLSAVEPGVNKKSQFNEKEK